MYILCCPCTFAVTIIYTLVAIVITGLAATVNLNLLFGLFKSNCLIGAELNFNCTPPTHKHRPKSQPHEVVRTIRAIPIVDDTMSLIMGTRIRHANRSACRIDGKKTTWGTFLGCEYAMFLPVMMAIFATIWFVIFAMCGHGGRGTEA